MIALALRGVLALALTLPVPSAAQEHIRAVDGDTLRVGPERIRILGLDTPETGHARCAYERRLGDDATRIAAGLIAGGGVEIERTGRLDRYGRSLARVTVWGVEWIAAMHAAGAVARPYDGGRRRGWCG